jgi:hypothetical protein
LAKYSYRGFSGNGVCDAPGKLHPINRKRVPGRYRAFIRDTQQRRSGTTHLLLE